MFVEARRQPNLLLNRSFWRMDNFLYNNFVSVAVLEILLTRSNKEKNCNIFLVSWHLPDLSQASLSTPRITQNLLNMQYFPNHFLLHFFFSWDRLWFTDKSSWRLNYIPYLGFYVPGFCLIYLSNRKVNLFSLELYWKNLLHLLA